MARPQSEALAGRETRRRRLKLVPVSTNVFEESSPPIRRRRHTQPRLLDQATVFIIPQEIFPPQLITTELSDDGKRPESANPQTSEPRKNLPPGARRRMVILGLMRLNATQAKPEFYGIYDKRFIEDIYGRRILDPQGNKSPAKIRSHIGAAFQARNTFIAALENPERQSNTVVTPTMALVDEIRSLYPYYKDLTIPQIIGLLKRTIDFSEVIRPVTVPAEEVLPDGFVVKKRTYIPSAETKPLPTLKNEQKPEKSHLPPVRKLNRKPRVVLESKELPKDVFPKLPKNFHTMTPEEIVAYSLMLIKDNGESYRYPNTQAAVLRIYDDPILRINQLSPRKRASINIPSTEHANAILASFISKLRRYDGSEEIHGSGRYHKSEVVHNFVTWADKQALYEDFTPEELAEVLTRHMPFEDVLEGYRKGEHTPSLKPTNVSEETLVVEEARLSLKGKYLISNALWDMSPGKLASLGIDITEERASTISGIIESFESQDHKDEDSLIKTIGPVVNMLRELFKDPSALLKRVKDPETKLILSTLKTLRPSKRDEFIKSLLSSR